MSPADSMLILFIQASLIIALSRMMGLLFARMRQPQVVGEMMAGIMLGPTLLGAVAPGFHQAVFPKDSIEVLHLLSQLGVVFFLFLVGLEFDPNLIRRRGRVALIISASSIASRNRSSWKSRIRNGPPRGTGWCRCGSRRPVRVQFCPPSGCSGMCRWYCHCHAGWPCRIRPR